MKKSLILLILIMSSITMYFILFWNPNSNRVEDIKEVNSTEIKKNNQKNENEEKRIQEEKEAMEKENAIEKNKNIENINRLIKNMSKEDKINIENSLNELSTVDLMKIKEKLNEGKIDEVKKILNERLLQIEEKNLYEIIKKYK
ncbi:hypothetical protein [uncultured Clostridium sp.]|uniref:hypothetical protein n=1 Tax=uncultured Clostridium sp. TaxID=59620 RepID=UPI00261D0842|nr:hypothetical protein [uncultured Clostridium sp.]